MGWRDIAMGLPPGILDTVTSTLLYDLFTDADATSLDAHTPTPITPGNAWVEVVGDWAITSNAAYIGASVLVSRAFIDIGQRASVVTGSVRTGAVAASPAGIFCRADPAGNTGWMLDIVYGTNLVRLYEVTGASAPNYTLRDSVAFTVADQFYTLELQDDGTNIVGLVDGVEKVSYTSAAYAAQTGVGLGANNTAARFDWLQAR